MSVHMHKNKQRESYMIDLYQTWCSRVAQTFVHPFLLWCMLVHCKDLLYGGLIKFYLYLFESFDQLL